jgi:hypothetical protein
VNPTSLYESAMGGAFVQLPIAVQRFHRLAGRHVLHGWVHASAPASLAARLLALCLGSPQRASSGEMRFELDARPDTETWTRCFPSRTMVSRMRIESGKVVEQLGAARLTFELLGTIRGLEMHLTGMLFLGIPCPRWLLPRIVAQESGDADRLHFHVAASLPLVGEVAAYRGHLVVPEEGSA